MFRFLRRRRGGVAAKNGAARRGTRPVPPELLKQVKLIELKTRGLVNTLFTGEYRSVFKGQGMEFAEVREYLPGDEVRSIDWNVTARMHKPFVKRYIEERELTVMLALDFSGSESFGTAQRFKSELATEFAALITMAAVRNNDRVGTLFFTDRVEYVVPPRKGKRHALRLVRDMLAFEPDGKATDLRPALEHLQRTLRQHTVIFVVSDFMAEGFEQPLRMLAQRHDVVAVTVHDPAEQTLPSVGVIRVVDPETGTYVEVDTDDAAVRKAYAERVSADDGVRRRTLRRLGIDEIVLTTDNGVVQPLLQFFRARETRLRRA